MNRDDQNAFQTPEYRTIRELLETSSIEDRNGRFEASVTLLLDALAIARKLHSREIQSEVENALGNLYGRHRQYQKQLVHCRRAVRLLGPKSNPLKRAIAEMNLASGLNHARQYTEAVRLLHRALRFYTNGFPLRSYVAKANVEHAEYAVSTLYSLASVLHSIGSYKLAIEYLGLCRDLERRLDLGHRSNTEGLLGSCYMELGDLAQAAVCFDTQLLLARQENDDRSVAMALSGLGEVSMLHQDLMNARTLLLESLRLSDSLDDPHRAIEVLCTLARLELPEGSHKLAREYAEAALARCTSDTSNDIQFRVHSLLADVIQATADQSEAVVHLRAALGCSLQLIKDTDRQEAVRLNEVFHNREVRRERDYLRELAKQHARNSTIDLDAMTHQLARQWPGLTTMELKVCALLRAGLTTKEVARELGLSRHTVDGHRTSVRKKLGLEGSRNLYTFLVQRSPTPE